MAAKDDLLTIRIALGLATEYLLNNDKVNYLAQLTAAQTLLNSTVTNANNQAAGTINTL